MKARADPVRRARIGGIGATGIAAVGGIGWTLSSPMVPSGSMDGADVASGHRLRSGDFPAPAAIEEAEIVIAGGGMAGLAAGWTLAEAGVRAFRLIELGDGAGGNGRRAGKAVTAARKTAVWGQGVEEGIK